VRGRMFIPGRLSGEGCEGACNPSMYDFGGGCGCEGCDSGCGGCESGCAVDGCAGCASCADTGCETAGCAETGCTTTSDTGCETTGCAETGCTTTSDTGCTDSGCAQAACAETGCTTTSDTGCTQSDTGCDTGCNVSCAETGCSLTSDTGCVSCADSGCAVACAETGCSLTSDTGCAVPFADGMAPTSGADFTGGGQGFGIAGPAGTGFVSGPAGANYGMGNAVGPPGWATGDYGAYGIDGPTGTGFGPGAPGATIGGPGAYASMTSAAGINGFPGDFGAPPGGTFGMPNTQDVGPQAGPGLLGGPTTVQQGEALNPSLFGPEVTTPDRVAPDDRTEVDPTTVFGPEFATNQGGANAGWFGPSQAQAASRGTDTDAMLLQSDPFAQVAQMAQTVAQTNPALAEALMGIAANQNNQTNMIGPAMTGFEGPSPGAQQGFTGTSAQQGTMSFDSFGGKGDSLNQSDRADTQQVNPNMDLIGPMVTQQGYQQLAAEMNAQQPQTPTVQGQQQQDTFDSRFDAVQSPNQAVQNAFEALSGKPATSDTFDSRFGEMQAPAYDLSARPAAETQMTPQQTISNAFEALIAANQQQAMQQAAMFDAQARGEQGRAGRADDTFDSRFGTFPMTADAFDAQSRGEQSKGNPLAPWAQTETIGPQIGPNIMTQEGLGRIGSEAAPLGLLGMYGDPSGRPGGSLNQSGPFGPAGRPGGETSGRPGLSVTVGNNQYATGRPGGQQGGGRPGGPGYYQTGGAGIAPGARGAEFGGMYGPGVATGRAGTNTFGVSSREGAYGFYDPATGLYYR